MSHNSITGTLINYYFHCQTQCWLSANRINLEDNSEDVRVGKILHLFQNRTREVAIDNIRVDKLTQEYLIEVKKSDSDPEAAKWQVLLYLYRLRLKGIERKGRIEFIEKNNQNRKIHYVELDEVNERELLEVLAKIETLITAPKPPPPIYAKSCERCAYYEYCFI